MKRILAILGLGAALGMAILPPAEAIAAANVIIPGESIGQTYLGSDSDL